MNKLKYLFLLVPILCTPSLFAQNNKFNTKLKAISDKIEIAAKNNSDSLEILVKQGVELAKKEGNKTSMIRFKHLLGLKAFKEADYKKAVENYLSAIKIGEKQNPSDEYVHVLFDASEVYRRIDKDTSMNFIRRGLSYAENLKTKDLMADGYNRLGYAFEIRNQNDSALHYYQKGLNINLQEQNKLGTSYAYESIAGIYNKQEKSKTALVFLKKSYQLRNEVKDTFAESISLINIAETFKNLRQVDSAINYAKKAEQIAKTIKFFDLMVYANSFLSDIYKQRGDFKNAFLFKEQNMAIKDSIFNIEKTKQITELDRKYQTEKRIQQINILEQQAVISNLKVKQRNIWLLIVLVVMISAGAIIYFVFNRRKLKAKAELQSEIIKQQDIASKAVLNAEERERRRIAGDLHDGVGQMLSAALMNLNGLFSKLVLPEENKLKAERALSLVSESYDEMRSISHQMMPNALIKSGLATAVKEFVGKLNKESLKVSLEIHGLNNRLDDQVETVIYRVIQESVNNVIKHAEATKLDIQIVHDQEGVDVTIEDNGKGFDKYKANPAAGIGLSNIYSRVAFLKGTVDIDSAEGRGTLIAIHIPI